MWLNGDHKIITARQLVLKMPEGFTESSFDPIAVDGVADLLRDRQAESRVSACIWQGMHDQGSLSCPTTFAVDSVEIGWTSQTIATGEAPFAWLLMRAGHHRSRSSSLW